MKILPQEIEVWYVFPSLRKELANIFSKRYKIKQKEIANLLQITESAVSQYLNDKRANEFTFTKKEKELIATYAKKMLINKEQTQALFLALCKQCSRSKSVCELHMKKDKSLPKNCKICFS